MDGISIIPVEAASRDWSTPGAPGPGEEAATPDSGTGLFGGGVGPSKITRNSGFFSTTCIRQVLAVSIDSYSSSLGPANNGARDKGSAM